MRLNVIEHLRPKGGFLFRRDRRRNQSGVHHLHQIVVHQVLVRRLDDDWRLALLLQRLVHLLQVCVIGGKRVDVHLFSAQVGQGGDRAEIRSRYDDLGYVRLDRRREGNPLFALGRDHDSVSDHVSHAFRQGRLNLVGSHRNECDFHVQRAGLQLLIGELLELLQRLVHHAFGMPLVVEETDGVEDDQCTNVAVLRHLIEIAGATPENRRERDVARGRRRLIRRRYGGAGAACSFACSVLAGGSAFLPQPTHEATINKANPNSRTRRDKVETGDIHLLLCPV